MPVAKKINKCLGKYRMQFKVLVLCKTLERRISLIAVILCLLVVISSRIETLGIKILVSLNALLPINWISSNWNLSFLHNAKFLSPQLSIITHEWFRLNFPYLALIFDDGKIYETFLHSLDSNVAFLNNKIVFTSTIFQKAMQVSGNTRELWKFSHEAQVRSECVI